MCKGKITVFSILVCFSEERYILITEKSEMWVVFYFIKGNRRLNRRGHVTKL